jgi:hypothetical protein
MAVVIVARTASGLSILLRPHEVASRIFLFRRKRSRVLLKHELQAVPFPDLSTIIAF